MSGQGIGKNNQKSFFDRPQRSRSSDDLLKPSGVPLQSRQSRNLIFQFGISPVWQHCTQDILVCPPRIGSPQPRPNKVLMDLHGQTTIDNRRWISITEDELGIAEFPYQDDEEFIDEERQIHPYHPRGKRT